MTAKIIWICAGALVTVGAIVWLGRAVEAKDEKTDGEKPQG
jgi:hypothetical protein